ncbi:MAG: hydrogenase maturation protease [Lutibacter sp.]|uniref:hydrogenase maturation protease n=1 Tax=Lutibacter sp. TaxID=1925666 RepID=UPI0017FB7F81|nr:hydrogenase maturation protease [Lutibacter sp.]MBT8317191.1 hydrogenase maturation protease [Lutibacter sp.]NNJ58050.1 hydrogenase maturation protease [Lutibacter sp.]
MKKLDNTLIIGIGNNTRQDDGLGWSFIELLEKNNFNSNNLVYKYQLMVEDAELISNYSNVVFVDACKSPLPNGFSIERIYASKQVSFSTHEVPPNQILNLCQTVYNKNPVATLIKIQGYDWDIKIGLTKKALNNLTKTIANFKLLDF